MDNEDTIEASSSGCVAKNVKYRVVWSVLLMVVGLPTTILKASELPFIFSNSLRKTPIKISGAI